jgi:hypothetical protein
MRRTAKVVEGRRIFTYLVRPSSLFLVPLGLERFVPTAVSCKSCLSRRATRRGVQYRDSGYLLYSCLTKTKTKRVPTISKRMLKVINKNKGRRAHKAKRVDYHDVSHNHDRSSYSAQGPIALAARYHIHKVQCLSTYISLSNLHNHPQKPAPSYRSFKSATLVAKAQESILHRLERKHNLRGIYFDFTPRTNRRSEPIQHFQPSKKSKP